MHPALRSAIEAASALREPHLPSLVFSGDPAYDGAWPSLVAIERAAAATIPLDRIDRRVRERRRRGGPSGTGVAAVFAYESAETCLALEVDAALTWTSGQPEIVATDPPTLRRARARVSSAPAREPGAFHARGPLRTSLPRERYEAAVERIRSRIALGDFYQANLTQRFEIGFDGDPFAAWRALLEAGPAPRAAFLETSHASLASVSPEVFVDVDREGRVTTRPIKGTRPRGDDAASDAAAAAALLASEKDRAELVMIVDLERNDLGRVCETGSVRVPEIAALRTYPAVHHLVARVEGLLRAEVGPGELVRAVFPGGSITGAPKLAAREALAELEPVPRGWYTGSLFWFADDGSTASSILIRSVVLERGVASIGAGGGVTADSDPRGEWEESNAKARAILRVFGRDPEEAR
ncbi:MAG TPA: anthranilate synthase component I family protein [Candidatus Polarisedimenticolaceae bacterium]